MRRGADRLHAADHARPDGRASPPGRYGQGLRTLSTSTIAGSRAQALERGRLADCPHCELDHHAAARAEASAHVDGPEERQYRAVAANLPASWWAPSPG